jgi:hypothetical protein
MVDCRLANPQAPVVYGSIWNNAICSFLHQKAKHIDRKHGIVESAFCMDPVGWQSGPFAEYIHNVLLKHITAGTTESLYLDDFALENTRYSISNFCFFGGQMQKMMPEIDDEEIWLTEVYPEKHKATNLLCGSAMVSHYSFFAQRPHLDKTDILERYRKVGQNLLSSQYYNLLGKATA